MSVSSHPAVQLRLEYNGGSCSAGAALAVATHYALCRQCAQVQPVGAWALASALADDHGPAGEAYTDALGAKVVADWRGANGGIRIASMKGVSSLGEATYLVEAATGASIIFPGVPLFLVVLQGVLADGPTSFTRGDFIDMSALHLLSPSGAGPHGCVCLVISENP